MFRIAAVVVLSPLDLVWSCMGQRPEGKDQPGVTE